MRKSMFQRVTALFLLILLLIGCSASSGNGKSASSGSASKASSIEQKIVGKWNGSLSGNGDKISFFDGWIELKDDLTGSSDVDKVRSFTWSYKEMMEGQYYFDVNVNGSHCGILFDESNDLLSLVIPPDTYLMFDR
ncbi:MAG: hypothetical protein IJI34_01100 [Clostridia bacterium]|nr:hypothetical protein [Clostridia bacterium]